MKFFMTALIFALLAAQVVPAQSKRSGERSNIPAKEYAIYAAVIGDVLANGELSPDPQLEVELLVIAGQTVKNHQAAIVGQDEGKIMKQEFSRGLDNYATPCVAVLPNTTVEEEANVLFGNVCDLCW